MKNLIDRSRSVITHPVLSEPDPNDPFKNGVELREQSPRLDQVFMNDCEVNDFEFVKDL